MAFGVFHHGFQIVHQIRFHAVNHFKVAVFGDGVVGVRERLHVAVIGNGNRFMPPFHRTLYDVFYIGYAVHIAHFGMAVQFYAL